MRGTRGGTDDGVTLQHLDLFSGIGGFSLAARRAGFTTVAFCEIDPFCRRVLARHWPEVPCFEDVQALTPESLRARGVGRVDLITFGFPCQDVSIAGKRSGLAGDRTGLFWEAVRLAKALEPTWLVAENVPGLLSSNDGEDMATVVGALADLGYLGAWRVLDAQWFGVAQRRRRVFVVGCAGAGRLTAVLPFLESGDRHPAPRRETGQGTAAEPEGGAYSESGPGWWRDGLGTLRAEGDNRPSRPSNLIAGTLGASGAGRARPAGNCNEPDFLVARCDTAGNASGGQRYDAETETLIARPLRAQFQLAHREDADTLIAIQTSQTGANGSNISVGVSPTLDGSGAPAVAHSLTSNGFDASEDGTGRGTPLVASPVARAQRAGRTIADTEGDEGNIVAFGISNDPTPKIGVDVAPPCQAKADGGGRMDSVSVGMTVRRLTGTECERLQGFSWREGGEWQDGWTCLCGRNAGRSWPEGEACRCADGPRYRALGNAIAVPVVEWILRHVAAAERKVAG